MSLNYKTHSNDRHCLYCIEKTMFYNVYTNHVGEKTLENKSLHCSPVIYIFLRYLSTFFTGILDGSLFLLNLVLKVDFQKKLVDHVSLFPSNMVVWLSISQDAVWFIFLSLQLNDRIIYLNGRRFYFYSMIARFSFASTGKCNSMIELFTSKGEAFDSTIARFSFPSAGKCNSMGELFTSTGTSTGKGFDSTIKFTYF